eukprot:1176585-Prorocentrum_minimum.AAC.4
MSLTVPGIPTVIFATSKGVEARFPSRTSKAYLLPMFYNDLSFTVLAYTRSQTALAGERVLGEELRRDFRRRHSAQQRLHDFN